MRAVGVAWIEDADAMKKTLTLLVRTLGTALSLISLAVPLFFCARAGAGNSWNYSLPDPLDGRSRRAYRAGTAETWVYGATR
jgi:hypothetical protein